MYKILCSFLVMAFSLAFAQEKQYAFDISKKSMKAITKEVTRIDEDLPNLETVERGCYNKTDQKRTDNIWYHKNRRVYKVHSQKVIGETQKDIQFYFEEDMQIIYYKEVIKGSNIQQETNEVYIIDSAKDRIQWFYNGKKMEDEVKTLELINQMKKNLNDA